MWRMALENSGEEPQSCLVYSRLKPPGWLTYGVSAAWSTSFAPKVCCPSVVANAKTSILPETAGEVCCRLRWLSLTSTTPACGATLRVLQDLWRHIVAAKKHEVP
jgi:hypothetical protein